MKSSFFLLLASLSLISFGQTQSDWVAPVDIPVQLSGTFGEFRNNHFHAGLDIRTQGRQGLTVKSVQSGWVRRVRISVSGYGKALYIDHPDGTTSVYAHLKKFAPKIEAYVKEKQYQKESFTIQLFPKINELSVEAGEIIGYSGNTGESYGPHLHFEMRETKGQLPINAMRYLLDIEDSQRPQIQNFYLYTNTGPFSSRNEFPLVKKNDSVYTTAGISASGKINVGLRLFDRQDRSYNKNGIYSASVQLNGIEYFSYQMDRMSFTDAKYINVLIDYQELAKSKRRIQRLVAHPEQKLSFLKNLTGTGELEIESGKSYQLLVEIKDYHQNTTTIEAYLTGTSEKSTPNTDFENILDPSKDYLFDLEDKSVYFPKKSFFDPVDVKIEFQGDTLYVGKNKYPLRNTYEVKYKVPQGDSLTLAQSFLAFVNDKGNTGFFTNYEKEGFWQGKSKTLGSYVISRDSVAPTIKAVNFKSGQWLSNYSFLRFKISDDYSGLQKFRGEINGRWIRLEHEPKNNSLIYDFSDLEFEEALHELTIEAEDQVGNKTVFKRDFYRTYN
ncbi:MAG: M23 family metallopeptidase [Flavobacteriaceae bacterium]|nr:M23 family metallopeptidase [Flavobacteriaceae bacterium]